MTLFEMSEASCCVPGVALTPSVVLPGLVPLVVLYLVELELVCTQWVAEYVLESTLEVSILGC